LDTVKEAESAAVQQVASRALAVVCEQAQLAAQNLQQQATLAGTSIQDWQQQQPLQQAVPSPCPDQQVDMKDTDSAMNHLQDSLALVQLVFEEYERAGLGYVIDLSSSRMTDELPEAAPGIDQLLEQVAGNDGDQAGQQLMALRQQQESGGWQQQHQWLVAAARQWQLVQQLMAAIQHEALPSVAAWAAAAAAAAVDQASSSTNAGSGADGANGADGSLQEKLLVMRAGPVSQLQLWHAAARLVRSRWQQLQQQLQRAVTLEHQMHALAAVAAAGGAAAIVGGSSSTSELLLPQVDLLQQVLLPLGFDCMVMEECVASAQLLQMQWNDLEEEVVVAISSCLCPLLGLTSHQLDLDVLFEDLFTCKQQPQQQQQQAGTSIGDSSTSGAAARRVDQDGVAVLQQLLSAAAASVGSGAVMHTKEVFEALSPQTSAAAAAEAGSSSSSVSAAAEVCWGTAALAGAWKSLVVLLLQWGCMVQQQWQQQQDQVCGMDGRAASIGAASQGVDAAVCSGAIQDVLHDSSRLPLDLEAYKPLVLVIQALDQLLAAPPFIPGEGGLVTAEGDSSANPSTDLARQLQLMLLPAVAKPLLQQLQQELLQLQQHLHVLSAEAEQVMLRHGQHWQRREGNCDISSVSRRSADDAANQQQQQQGAAVAAAPEWEGSSSAGSCDAALGSCLQGLVPFEAFDPSLPGADMALEDEEALLEDDEVLDQDAEADDNCCPFVMDDDDDDDDDGDNDDDDDDDDAWLAAAAAEQDENDSGTAVDAGLDSVRLPEMPQLVPFSDFDFTLPGEGAALEDEGLVLEGQGASTSSLAGLMDGDAALDDLAAGQVTWQQLAEQLQAVGAAAAAVAAQRQQLTALQQVGTSCEYQQQVWMRHLAAFEWMWGELWPPPPPPLPRQPDADEEATQCREGSQVQQLQQCAQRLHGVAASLLRMPLPDAVRPQQQPGSALQLYCQQQGLLLLLPGLPAAASIPELAPELTGCLTDSSGGSTMPSRAQLLAAWQWVADQAGGLEARLVAWQAASSDAASTAKDVLLLHTSSGSHDSLDPSVGSKVGGGQGSVGGPSGLPTQLMTP
jgi:hypothetical protein